MTYVEAFVGISGQEEGVYTCPDGVFLPPMPLNAAEQVVRQGIERSFSDRVLTIGRDGSAYPAAQRAGPVPLLRSLPPGMYSGGIFQQSQCHPACSRGNRTTVPAAGQHCP